MKRNNDVTIQEAAKALLPLFKSDVNGNCWCDGTCKTEGICPVVLNEHMKNKLLKIMAIDGAAPNTNPFSREAATVSESMKNILGVVVGSPVSEEET